MLHAAGVVSYQNDSVSWWILASSTASDCFAAACMPVQLVSSVLMTSQNMWLLSADAQCEPRWQHQRPLEDQCDRGQLEQGMAGSHTRA